MSSASMSSEVESYRLWCIVEGDNTPFEITVSTTTSIAHLKEVIKATDSDFLQGVNALRLTLWKPLEVIPIVPSKTLPERIGRDISQFAEELDPGHSVAHVFQNPNQYPTDPRLDIIAQTPAQTRAIPRWSIPLDDDRPPSKRRRLFADPFDEGSTVCGSTNNTFLHTPSKPLDVVKSTAQNILERYRSKMRELVAKAGREPLIPLWSPKMGSNDSDMKFRKHAEKLAIPMVNGMPSLLLHELGCESSIVGQMQAENVADIFSFHDHVVLINTPGSGKTRLGLHGLCQNWGFYGVVVQQAVDDIGSRDFQQLMSDLDGSLDYSRANSIGSQDDQAARHMHQKVQRRVLQFILARFLFLNLLIDEASKSDEGLRPSDHRYLWVFLQVRPVDILGNDAFLELSEALYISSLKDLRTQINEEYSKLACILNFNLPTRQPLYFFLDEIQSTTTDRMGQYRSNDSKKESRPLLRPIWESMTQIFEREKMLLIISGTAINEDSLESVLNSAIFKFKSYKIRKDIGGFDDPEIQRQYIEHYLPPLDDQMEARQEFLKRAWGWCRGRYRSTATLIALIIATGPNSPHKILNKFVEGSTNFSPTDGENWSTGEPDVSSFDNDMKNVRGWRFDSLKKQQIDVLCDILYGQIVYGFYSLKPFAPDDDIKPFIEYGFARTKRRRVTDDREYVIDEPLAIMAISNWLEKEGHFSLLECLHRDIGKHAPRRNGFEAYLALYFRKAFEKTAKLNDIFTFWSDFACRKDLDLSWQMEKFELVTISISAGMNERRISAVTPSCGPSSNVGIQANTDDEVLNWISENKECYPFCFPIKSAGPDIFFHVRSTETGRLLLVALQAKYYKNVDKETLVQGVHTVTPPFFGKGKGKKAGEVDNGPSVVASRLDDALMKIENCIAIKNAPYPVLCVFASWPADAKLERTLELKESNAGKAMNSLAEVDGDGIDSIDSDEHPLATLHLGNFEGISCKLAKSWFHQGAEQEIVFLEKDQYDDKKLRRSKRRAQLAGTMA